MATRVIRVDNEVYATVLRARHELEAATGATVSVAFLVALSQLGTATA